MIKLIKPSLSYEDIETEIQEIFNSGQFTQGVNVDKFKLALKQYIGVNYLGLTTSATTALVLALRICGVKAGDKVAVSDYSWPASSNVIEEVGAIPIFIDINPETFNMCPRDLKSKINKDVSAVIFVDTFGNPSGVNLIKDICDSYQIPLIEDAACALGSEIDNRKVGTYADITCYSFHPRKVINTGEGGAICTNNQEYADEIEIKLSAGASGRAEVGLNFTDYGFNYRLTEIQSLMGWKQILTLDELINKRSIVKQKYLEKLTNLGFIEQKVDQNVKHNFQSIVFLVPENINRNMLIDHLYSKNIESTLGTYCLSSTKFNIEKYNNVQNNSSLVERMAITLPCYEGVDVDYVVSEIDSFINK